MNRYASNDGKENKFSDFVSCIDSSIRNHDTAIPLENKQLILWPIACRIIQRSWLIAHSGIGTNHLYCK